MTVPMRVLVYDGPHRFHLEERARPEPARDQVRVRIAFVGICGSDLHGYTGASGRRVPGMVMGHEASGWIEALGPGVEGLAVGQPVTFNPSLPCDGACGHLAENQCSRLEVIGVNPQIQGAFADAIVVPAARVVPIGDLDLATGALIEPMAVAVHAARRAGVSPGDRVLVVGGGMIGQCIGQAAGLAGAAEIVVSEGMEERRQLARSTGFTAISPEEVGDLPPFDRSFDAVGVSASASTALTSIHKGGTACFVGLGRSEVTIPLFDVVVGERSIVGSFCYPDEVFREAATYLKEGKLDPDPYLGTTVAFEDAGTAFESLALGERKEVKILVTTNSQAPGNR